MGYNVAIVGATGAVGQELIRLLGQRTLPINQIKLLASSRSAGKTMMYRGQALQVETLSASSIDGVDIAFFSAGSERSRQFAPVAIEAGAVVIDNSSAFRMQSGVPLIVPEINGKVLRADDRLIANPNCTAAILLMALGPISKLGHVTRIIASTYQSASGAGAAAMEELVEQTRAVLNNEPIESRIMPHPYAFNLFSHNTQVNADGLNEEEVKVAEETRKILDRPDLKINTTCVRVPILRAHSISATIEFEGVAPEIATIRQALEHAPGVRVVENPEANHYPMPVEASGSEDVLVGRLRKDPSSENAISLFICGDQLLKGAALNAVQIAELLHDRGLISPSDHKEPCAPANGV